jgi:hypothetical protein
MRLDNQSLLKHYYKNNYIISAPSQATHFSDRNPAGAEILHFAVLSNLLSSHSVRTLGSLSTSDHNLVLLHIRGPLKPEEIKLHFIYRDANWELFQNYLVNNLNTQRLEGNCSKSEIDVALVHLTDTLNRATLYAVPLKRRTFNSMHLHSCAHSKKEQASDAVPKNPWHYSPPSH